MWYAEDGFLTRTLNATAGGTPVRAPSTRGKPAGVLAVAYARDGQLATVGRDNSARLWQSSGNQLLKLDGFADVPSRIAFSHDAQRLFAGDVIGTVRGWNLNDKQPAGEFSTNP